MKRSYKFCLASLLLASSVAYSALPAEGWYIGLIGGLRFSPSVSFQPGFQNASFGSDVLVFLVNNPIVAVNPLNTNIIINNGKMDFRTGGLGGGQIGYRYDKFRFEGEFVYGGNAINSLTFGNLVLKRHFTPLGARLDGSVSVGSALFNIFYEIYDEDCDPSFIPYVGLGLGYSVVQARMGLSYPNNFVFFDASRNTNAVTGQAILGLSYFFSDETSLSMDYRFMSTRQTNLFNTGTFYFPGLGTAAVGLPTFNSRSNVQTLNFTLNYSFDAAIDN